MVVSPPETEGFFIGEIVTVKERILGFILTSELLYQCKDNPHERVNPEY